MLSPISDSPMDFHVRTVLATPAGSGMAYLFGRAIKEISASEELLQETILNIESNDEFVIYARIKIMSGSSKSAGCLFSIAHKQRKLLLLDLSTKGSGSNTKLILRYRSTSDTAENVVFKDVAVLGDRKYHTIILRITDVIDNGRKISAVTLYVDCKFFGKGETVSPISTIFSYKGTLLSLLDFRIGQRRSASPKHKLHTQWKVCNN